MTEPGSRADSVTLGSGRSAPVLRSGYFYWVTKIVLTPVLAVLFRPRVEGVRHVPRRGPAILACNHVSFLDWMFLPLVVRFRHIAFLAKLEYFTRPGLKGALQRFFFTATGQVPVDRTGTDGATAALRAATGLLADGRLVGVFPEGTRSRDGRLYRGRTGVARLAAETGVPVIPCATVGVFEVAPPGTRIPRPRRIGVRFGPPRTWPAGTPTSPTALRTWTDELMAEIGRLSGQEVAGVDAWAGRPRRPVAPLAGSSPPDHGMTRTALGRMLGICARRAAQDSGADGVVEQTLLRRDARLEPVPSSAGEARRVVRQVLLEVGEESALDAAEIVVSELVTNAILHAATEVELTIEVTASTVHVAVRDWHPRLPTQRHWGETATTGRGLGLVAALTDAFGVEPRDPVGKAVWFQLSRGDATRPAPESAWDLPDLLDEAEGPGGTGDHRVQLAGMPARLWSAGQQHWEAVLRELYLYLQSPDRPDSPSLDLTAAGQALVAISNAVDRAVTDAMTAGVPVVALPSGHPSPLPAMPESVDVELTVSSAEQTGYAALQDALDAGIRLGSSARLLIRPALPEVVALRDWACEQVLAQAHGVPATPWAGADHPRFVDPAVVQHTAPVPAWDAGVVTGADRPVVAADDNNRLLAVSGPAAQLLGWQVDDLTGRRVVTIVPPTLREAHVAGFTRHLTTGETHVLGVPLVLPVLRADGTEIQCRFLIDRAAAEAGRNVYVAWLDPVED